MQPQTYTPPNMNYSASKRSYTGWVVSVVILAAVAMLGWEYFADNFRVMAYQGDPQIVRLAEGSGMSTKGKAIFYSKSPQLVDANRLHEFCPLANDNLIEYGCYHPRNNQIYILDTQGSVFAEAMYTTAAHEMLHAAWESLSWSQKGKLSDALQQQLEDLNSSEAKSIQKSLSKYDSSAAAIDDETHAFVGSQLPANQLDEFLNNHFDKYFSDRNLTVAANASFASEIGAIESDIDRRTKTVKAKEKELQKFEANHLTSIKNNMQQNLYYRDYTAYNKNVAVYNNNVEIYNQNYHEYRQQIDELNRDINQYNAMLDALKPDKKLDPLKARPKT